MSSLNFIGSKNAPNFMRSITGMSRNARVGPDIQVAAAMLRRVGLGQIAAFAGGFIPAFLYPTGPVAWDAGLNNTGFPNTTVDPLYLDCIVKIVWGDPGASTATYHIVYDLDYQDMTTTLILWGGTPTVNTNIAPGWAQTIFFSTNPGSPPPNFSYDTTSGGTYSQSISGTGNTVGTMTWSGYTDMGTTPPTVHYGATITITLSVKKIYDDYCQSCLNNILNTLTLGNNITSFSGSQLLTGETAFDWMWMKSFPKLGSAYSVNFTSGILAMRSRANGVQYKRLNSEIIEDNGRVRGASNRVRYFYDPFFGPSNFFPHAYRSIISGYGMPISAVPIAGNAVCVGADHSFIDLANQVVSYVMCLASCVRNNAPMGDNYKVVTFDPSTNSSSIAWSTHAGMPQSDSQTIFPASAGSASFGCVTVPFCKIDALFPWWYDNSNTGPGFNNNAPLYYIGGQIPFGTPTTFYACSVAQFNTVPPTYDFIETIPATWSLINMTGSIVAGDLVASADGRSAVFSAAHHGSCQIQCVSTVGSFTGTTITITI